MVAAAFALVLLAQASDIPRADDDQGVVPKEDRICIDRPDAPPGLRCAQPRPKEEEQPVVVEEANPPPRLVGSVSIFAGALVDTADEAPSPEFGFTGEVALKFPNNLGLVGLVHGHIAARPGLDVPNVHRYGLAAGLRIGGRSRLILALGPSLVARFQNGIGEVSGGGSVLLQGAWNITKWITLLAMPTVTYSNLGLMGSVALGVGATFY